MCIFIQASDYELWKIIVNGHKQPTKILNGDVVSKDENEWNKNAIIKMCSIECQHHEPFIFCTRSY